MGHEKCNFDFYAKHRLKYSSFLFFLQIFIFTVATPSHLIGDPQMLQFCGYEWIIKDTGDSKKGPGPNIFSSSQQAVRLDELGRLHLSVFPKDGVWHCSEVFTLDTFGYGEYTIRLSADPGTLDPNIVLGFFTYDITDSPYYQELDIEFSRWGIPGNKTGHYSVQPYSEKGNSTSFNTKIPMEESLHVIRWLPKKVVFSTFSINNKGKTKLVKSWIYKGDHIPHPNNPAFRINLWLFQGETPELGGEMIISDFSYIALEDL